MEELQKLIEDFRLDTYYHEDGVTCIVKGRSRKTNKIIDNSIVIDGTHSLSCIYNTLLGCLEEYLDEKYSYEELEDPEQHLKDELEDFLSEGDSDG